MCHKKGQSRSKPILIEEIHDDEEQEEIEEVEMPLRDKTEDGVEDIEDGDEAKQANVNNNNLSKQEKKKGNHEVVVGVKRKRPEPSLPLATGKEDDTTTTTISSSITSTTESGPRIHRRRLRDVVAELVEMWDSPFRYIDGFHYVLCIEFSFTSDPLDPPELRKRREKKRQALALEGAKSEAYRRKNI